ncbi:IS30 family transposase [uncultured Porphyromonas sp.]|uniref:IS30 family transposase n=1 Tax=uncultured Porphyromonas sp. TaxID=159274 RepID=UPI00260F624A|nr:IS30 family transposase [uncultured Porphyromonas sp.]
MNKKKYKHLTLDQRYIIESGLKKGLLKKEIAELVGVSPSTITREIKRNANKCGRYTQMHAQMLANEDKERVKRNKKIGKGVWKKVIEKLREDWSPQQISGWLKKEEEINISHETIYAYIRKDKAEGGKLYTHCRHQLKHRKRYVGSGSRSLIPDRVSIHERPPEADGSTFGDFEMDTIISAKSRAVILTIVERYSGQMFACKMRRGKDPKEISKTVVQLLAHCKGKIRSITTDNGSEFINHKHITEKLGVKVYFADPYSSWQKGTIEYSNKLLRQYLKKNEDFKDITNKQVLNYVQKINSRPRKKHQYKTPMTVWLENNK